MTTPDLRGGAVRDLVRERLGNVVAAVTLMVIAVTSFVATTDLPAPGRGNDPGAAGYPRLLGVVLAILAVALLFQRGGGEPFPRGRDAGRVLGILGLLLVYVNVLAALGFIAATVLFLVASLVLAGARGPLPLVLIPALLAGGIHYVFVVLFRVSLPRGLIERLLS